MRFKKASPFFIATTTQPAVASARYRTRVSPACSMLSAKGNDAILMAAHRKNLQSA